MKYEKFKALLEETFKDYEPPTNPIMTDDCSPAIRAFLDKIAAAETPEEMAKLMQMEQKPPARKKYSVYLVQDGNFSSNITVEAVSKEAAAKCVLEEAVYRLDFDQPDGLVSLEITGVYEVK